MVFIFLAIFIPPWVLHRFYTELSIINSHVVSLYLQNSQKSRVINILFCIFSCTEYNFENGYQRCYWGILTKVLSVLKQPVIPLRWFFPFDLCWHRLILIYFLLFISFSAMPSAIDQHNSCHNHQATCQKF